MISPENTATLAALRAEVAAFKANLTAEPTPAATPDPAPKPGSVAAGIETYRKQHPQRQTPTGK